MTGKHSNLSKLFNFLGTTEEEFRRTMSEAQKIVDYVDSRIGNKDFWQVSYEELKFLYAAVKHMKAKVVAETGVGPGTTSTAILTALKETGGKLVSFDLGQKYGSEEETQPVGLVIPEDLKSRWALILGDSMRTLEKGLTENGPIDIFFHDSEHTYEHVTFELETAKKHFKDKFLVVVDNYSWSDASADFAKKYGYELVNVADDMCFIFKS